MQFIRLEKYIFNLRHIAGFYLNKKKELVIQMSNNAPQILNLKYPERAYKTLCDAAQVTSVNYTDYE